MYVRELLQETSRPDVYLKEKKHIFLNPKMLGNSLILIGSVSVFCVYSPEKDKEIRQETVFADTYDPLSRPSSTTNVSIGTAFLSIDELVSTLSKTVQTQKHNFRLC